MAGRVSLPPELLPTLPPGVKPSYPVEIDRATAFGSRCVFCYVPQITPEAVDLHTGVVGSKTGTALEVSASQGGSGLTGATSSGNYISFPYPQELKQVEDITVFAVVRHTGSSGVDENNAIISQAYDDSYVGLFLTNTSFNAAIQGFAWFEGGVGWSHSDVTTDIRNTDQLYSVAGTSDGVIGRYYLNGSLDAEDGTNSADRPTSGTGDLHVAAYGDTTWWEGYIYCIYIFTGAFSADEVRQLHKDPYQILKPAVPQTQIITPASTPDDRVWIV